MIEHLKKQPQLADVMLHGKIDSMGIKFELTQPITHIYVGSNDKYYDADKQCLIILNIQEKEK